MSDFPPEGESEGDFGSGRRKPGHAPSSPVNLWRLGGLLGGLVFSLACWAIVFHLGAAVLAGKAPLETKVNQVLRPVSPP